MDSFALTLQRLRLERGWTNRQVAEAVQKSEMYVSRRLRVLDDAALRDAVLDGRLAVTTAEELLAADVGRRGPLLAQAVAENWSPADARQAVHALGGRSRRDGVSAEPWRVQLAALQSLLEQKSAPPAALRPDNCPPRKALDRPLPGAVVRGIVTARDRSVVQFVACHPWVVSEHVRRLLSFESRQPVPHVAPQVARRRLAVLVGYGLLAHGMLRLFGTPLSAYWLTRRGAVFLDLNTPPGGVDIRQLHHDAAVADVHLALVSQGATHIWTARTLASARARGDLPEGMLAHLGGRQVHIPDLIATLADSRRVAFEVEMSRKSPRRLAEIMRAYRLARGLDEVAYLTPGDARAQAIAAAGHGVSKVRVSRLQDLIPMRSWPPI